MNHLEVGTSFGSTKIMKNSSFKESSKGPLEWLKWYVKTLWDGCNIFCPSFCEEKPWNEMGDMGGYCWWTKFLYRITVPNCLGIFSHFVWFLGSVLIFLPMGRSTNAMASLQQFPCDAVGWNPYPVSGFMGCLHPQKCNITYQKWWFWKMYLLSNIWLYWVSISIC